MAKPHKSTSSRPKAKKAARTAKPTPKPAAKARPAKAGGAKAAPKGGAKAAPKGSAKATPKPAPKVAARAASPARGGEKPAAAVKGGVRPKLKAAPRPPAVVHPIGVLPPEAISRTPQRPARPVPLSPRPAKPARITGPDVGAQPVTAKDFPEFEQRLLEERVRVLKEMGHYESTVLKVNQRESAGDLSGYSFHMADVGTDAMEREKAFQLASAEGRILLELNEALRRIARGEYGVCESCENPILRARLEAMPVARLCLACKEKEERAARGIS
ncbi:MAG: TraR/DksA C4-type zinc finger protein [Candidatus Eiseniibacteriota bacterium]